MRYSRIVFVMLIAVLFVGCVPKRFEWSPDGKWMTALGNDGKLHFADANGNFFGNQIDGVGLATWFPDSRRLALSLDVEMKSWKEIQSALTSDQLKAIPPAAAQVRTALLQFDWKASPRMDLNGFFSQFTRQRSQAGQDVQIYTQLSMPIWFYLRDHDDGSLRKSLPASEQGSLTDPLVQIVHRVAIYSVDANGAMPVKTLMTTLTSINELRVSPTGQAVAIVCGNDNDSCDLFVASTADPATVVKINDQASWYPDWSSDGRDLVFIQAIGPKSSGNVRLGSLSQTRVIADDGKLLTGAPGFKELAGVIFDPVDRVRCARDGRILFASAQVTLPAVADDLPDRGEIFSLWPGKQNTISRLIAHQTIEKIGDSPQYFELSPDESKISIPDKTGVVWVVNLTNGAASEVQPLALPKHDNDPQLMSVPTWRNSDELTMVAPAENGKAKVVLWSMAKSSGVNLSQHWPANTIAATTGPTTGPP